MKAFKLWIIAIFLLTVVNIVNRVLYKRKIKHLPKAERKKKMQEYDRQEAMALDGFANKNYRTFWNSYLIKENGYKFGVDGEMISSALGKNEVDKTLSEKGKGKLYSPQSNLGSTKTIAGTNITYKVIILPGDASFTLGTSGFEKVMISITNPNKTIGTFTYPVTLYADEAMTEYVTIYFTSTFVNLV